MKDIKYGSGSFGTWFRDENDLPAYEYTCNQYKLEEKLPLTNKDSQWGDYRSHYAQTGNKRIVGIPSNFGWMKIRQDEGACKYLNEWLPEEKQYAGGFGWFVSKDESAATFYAQQEPFKRVFGTGYFTKETSTSKVHISQTITAPYGDDPVLLSSVTLTNTSDKETEGEWIEYWGTKMYQFTMRIYSYVTMKHLPQWVVYPFRTEFSKNFSMDFQPLENGVLLHRNFEGYTYPKKDGLIPSIDEVNAAINPAVGDANYEDLNIPDMFAVLLNGKADTFLDGQAFFANEDLRHPTGLDGNLKEEHKDSIFLKSKVKLAPGESKTLHFLVGYIPEGFDVQTLIAKYAQNTDDILKNSADGWKQDKIELRLPEGDEDKVWLERETDWNNYYLDSSLSYDTSLHTHVLSQGSYYQYIMGVQGGIRDSVQHMMPYLYTNPDICKELVDYHVSMIGAQGFAYGGAVIGYGVMGAEDPRAQDEVLEPCGGMGTTLSSEQNDMEAKIQRRFSEQEFWVMWLVGEYVKSHQNYAYLEEELPIYATDKTRKVVDSLLSAFEYYRDVVGTGRHGLNRLLICDWCRVLYHPYAKPIPQEERNEGLKIAESTFSTAIAIYGCQQLADLLKETGHPRYEEVQEYVDGLKSALKSTWNGKWIPRAWISENYGFLGNDDEIMLEPLPWVILDEVLEDDQNKTMIDNINEYLIKPSKLGAKKRGRMPWAEGVRHDGWIWWSINGPLIWCLGKYDPQLAYTEFKKNSLAVHADQYPDVWFGIWSNSDNYTSDDSRFPGYTRWDAAGADVMKEKEDILAHGKTEKHTIPSTLDFPVNNVHPHAWPLYDLIRFLQPDFACRTLKLAPILPKETYSISSRLLGWKQDEKGASGWYAPDAQGTYAITLKPAKTPAALEVNGEPTDFVLEDGAITFQTEKNNDKPIAWSLVWEGASNE